MKIAARQDEVLVDEVGLGETAAASRCASELSPLSTAPAARKSLGERAVLHDLGVDQACTQLLLPPDNGLGVARRTKIPRSLDVVQRIKKCRTGLIDSLFIFARRCRVLPPLDISDALNDLIPIAVVVHCGLRNSESFAQFLSVPAIQAHEGVRALHGQQIFVAVAMKFPVQNAFCIFERTR